KPDNEAEVVHRDTHMRIGNLRLRIAARSWRAAIAGKPRGLGGFEDVAIGSLSGDELNNVLPALVDDVCWRGAEERWIDQKMQREQRVMIMRRRKGTSDLVVGFVAHINRERPRARIFLE